jgi:AcrR family transcriptional regulator
MEFAYTLGFMSSNRKTPATKSAVPTRRAKADVPRKRLSRQERSGEARTAIFAAAAQVVGEYGYAEASISRITELAGIAQGTFYLYFSSRQELFDQLLLHEGAEMLEFLRRSVAGAKDVFDVEERAFRALFDYVRQFPGFIRILNEAEFVAPSAHRQHYKILCDRYVETLERAIKGGQIRNFNHDELETVASMLIAGRAYLLFDAYRKNPDGDSRVEEATIQTYMKLVRNGLK